MLVKKAFAFSLSLLIPTASAVHLDCATDPNADCDPATYCTFTGNNGNCASPGWGSDDQVPVFMECVTDTGCNGKCVNGLCCNTGILPNGEADCPTTDTISQCCFVRTPGPGGAGAWAPREGDRPSELSCGC
ncbi:hypothetical protein F53441_5700 [Fusarium austroafricanum]|uniref:Uncharacterized protein n=1 Tax=Fusarium austroafricanum TaxID=2364996 RepID=A0A8H4KKE6_9HYPO|nr:hypothetical protein F53441_5700 [Fusarium austroafricanum]